MIFPRSRPAWPQSRVASVLAGGGADAPVALLGVRGYFRDTMGAVGRNDYNLYDDAIFVLSPTAYLACNANTDPSRAGWNAKVGKPMAVLAPGLWRYRIGRHRTYTALVQAAAVRVLRGRTPDGAEPGKPETGWFGLNIHRGGTTSTGSEGCQTIVPRQWDEFIALVRGEADRHGVRGIPYLLIEAQG